MKMVKHLLWLLILLPGLAHAARCKVDGEWYPYSHPKCSVGSTEKQSSSYRKQTGNNASAQERFERCIEMQRKVGGIPSVVSENDRARIATAERAIQRCREMASQ